MEFLVSSFVSLHVVLSDASLLPESWGSGICTGGVSVHGVARLPEQQDSYNGQKHLIRDVLAQRCKHPVFGKFSHEPVLHEMNSRAVPCYDEILFLTPLV